MQFATLSAVLADSIVWSDRTEYIGTAARAQHGIIVDARIIDIPWDDEYVKPAPIFEGPVRLPVMVSGAAEDIIRPFESTAIEEALREIIAPRLKEWMWYGDPGVLAPWQIEREHERHGALGAAAAPERLVLGLRFELCRRGEVMARGEAWWRPERLFYRYGPASGMKGLVKLYPESIHFAFSGDAGELSDWTVRIIGDPAVAMRDFEATHYWKGEIEMPLLELPTFLRD